MTRLILYAATIGGALVLLCACAQQEPPAVTQEGSRPAARTAVPTRVHVTASAPSPPTPVEPTGGPLTRARAITDPGPSAADLAIESSGPVQPAPGETAIYTLTVRNLGPAPASGIVLTDVLPSGVTPLWTEPAQPVCGRQERSVGCDLGDLQAGDAATVTLDLTVSGSESLITSTQLAGVTVTLSVPVCTIDQDASSPRLTCRLSSLQPGAEAQAHVGLALEGPVVGGLVHTATVAAQEVDPNPSNNRAIFTAVFDSAGPVATTGASTTADLVLQADGPASISAGLPFTFTYAVVNRGALGATGVWFEDVVPSDLNLVAYAPGPPRCEQQGNALICYLRDPDSSETLTFTLGITGHGGQPMKMNLDPLVPGWPICWVIKERTWLHVVQCELGELRPGQATRVQLVFEAVGVRARTTVNTAAVHANETDPNPVDNTSTMTITVEAGAESSQP